MLEKITAESGFPRKRGEGPSMDIVDAGGRRPKVIVGGSFEQNTPRACVFGIHLLAETRVLRYGLLNRFASMMKEKGDEKED